MAILVQLYALPRRLIRSHSLVAFLVGMSVYMGQKRVNREGGHERAACTHTLLPRSPEVDERLRLPVGRVLEHGTSAGVSCIPG